MDYRLDRDVVHPAEIKAARMSRGLNKAEAAVIAMVPMATWRKWEDGTVPMTVAMLRLFLTKTEVRR